jgi:hypothetical protein
VFERLRRKDAEPRSDADTSADDVGDSRER